MKVAMLYSSSDIRIEDIPVPEIGDGDALVRIRACGICSGDTMPWYIEMKSPLVLGHEPAGDIVRVGKGVSFFQPGDRVFIHHHAPCFSCRQCGRGDYVQCSTWKASRIIPGGISEYVLVPETNLKGDTLLIPENLSHDHATLIEPVACVVKGFRRAQVKKGDTVLVMGLGVMGQIHVMLARRFGAGKVVAADSVEYRLACARKFGADAVINITQGSLPDMLGELTDGEMAEIVVVGPNSAEAMSQGIRCAAKGGNILFFTPSLPDEALTLKPNDIYFRDISIITSYSCGPDDTREALGLILDGTIKAEELITHRFPFKKTAEAFALTARARESLKVIVVNEEDSPHSRS